MNQEIFAFSAQYFVGRALRLVQGKRAAGEFAQVGVVVMVVGLIAAAVYALAPIVTNLLNRGGAMLG